MSSVGFEHNRNILREMLAVTVKGYCIGKAGVQSIPESFLQCSSLSLIHVKVYNHRLDRHSIQKVQRVICASVTYDDDIITLVHGT